VPAVLVHGHGPFAWGEDVAEAVENAIALEAVAALALRTLAIEPGLAPLDEHLRERQYTRKHGATMYYGSAANSVIADSPASRPTGTGA
jgi:L-ribulose-5-phosphate 4-epimerase